MSKLIIRTEPGFRMKYWAKVYKSYLWGAIKVRSGSFVGYGNTADEAIEDAKNKYVNGDPIVQTYPSVEWDGSL